MRQQRLMLAAAAVVTLLVLPAGTFAGVDAGGGRGTSEPRRAAGPLLDPGPDISPYEGVGTWIDMYDTGPRRKPEAAIDRMAALGVRTLYLQTSNWQKAFAIYKPDITARLIDRAHEHGIAVVAWYLPSFATPKKDWRRTKAAIEFETAAGNRFTSFALDIEATEVRDIAARNESAISLSRRIRDYVGEGYALGGIIPDPAGQLYWPDFPYTEMVEIYDVILPMGYYTYRTSGYAQTYRYAKRNVTLIRSESGDAGVPVHAIGGIAGRASRREVQAFLDGSNAAGVMGVSLYDYPITLDWEWAKLLR